MWQDSLNYRPYELWILSLRKIDLVHNSKKFPTSEANTFDKLLTHFRSNRPKTDIPVKDKHDTSRRSVSLIGSTPLPLPCLSWTFSDSHLICIYYIRRQSYGHVGGLWYTTGAGYLRRFHSDVTRETADEVEIRTQRPEKRRKKNEISCLSISRYMSSKSLLYRYISELWR